MDLLPCIKEDSNETTFQCRNKIECLTGFGRLPDIGQEGRNYKYIFGKRLLFRFNMMNLLGRKCIKCRRKCDVDLCRTIVVCFERQLHIFCVICIRFIAVGIMDAKELPKGKIAVRFFVFVEMRNKGRQFKQLA